MKESKLGKAHAGDTVLHAHACCNSDSDMNHSTVEPVATSGHLYKATTSLLWPLPMVLDDPFTFSILPA